MKPLVLASTSRYRRALLERLGLPFTAVAPDCDEDRVKALGLDAETLTLRLAREKAESIAPHHPGCLILGSDQVADLDGEILGKPGTAERACAQLGRMQGRAHRLVTALCLWDADTGEHVTEVDIHHLRLRPLAPDQIARYVAQDQPLDCAGSYKIEGPGIALFEAVEGRDFTAIIGLPLIRVVSLLKRFGVTLP